LYYDQSGFEIQPLSPLFLREDLGEFLKLENLKTTFTLVYEFSLKGHFNRIGLKKQF